MNVTDLYEDFPQAAYLFFFVPLFLVLFWLFFQYRQRILEHYTAEKKLNSLLVPEHWTRYVAKAAGFCLAWLCLALALMQPKGNARYPAALIETKQNIHLLHLQPHEVIFLIDSSASMTTLDGRLGQKRFDNAKEIADEVMSRLQGQSGSLYSFTSDVSKLSPPSMDYLFMRLMLRNMSINEGDASGTNLKAAIQSIHDHYLNPSTALTKTLILISDGEDNTLVDLQGTARQKYIQEIVDLVGDPNLEKLHIYSIGTGTVKGGEIPQLTYQGQKVTSHLNEDLLKALSEKGQGRYYSGNQYSAVDIASDLALQIAKADVFVPADITAGLNPQEDLVYDLYYQIPLGLAILLLALYLLTPDTEVLRSKMKTGNFTTASLSILLLWMICGTLQAAEDKRSEQLRLGAAYFSAGEYPAAINIYQSLLNEELTGWERSVVVYNLGTALAAQGQEEKALENLRLLPFNENSSPLLAFRTSHNLAMANFRRGHSLNQEFQIAPPATQDPFFKAIYFFQQALDEIPLAQKAHCHLFEVLGESYCPQDLDLEEAHAVAKMGIAQLRSQQRHHLIEHSSLQEGIPWLLTGLQLLEKDLAFLLDYPLSPDLLNSYQKLFKNQISSWNPLWNTSKERVGHQRKYSSLFVKADEAFVAAQKAFDESDFIKAQANFSKASKYLNQLLQQLFSADRFQEVVALLLNDFSLAALQDPLEGNTLLYIQQKLNEITWPKTENNSKKEIEAIKDHLEHSLAATQNHQDIFAHIYFNEAWQALKRVFLLLEPNLHENPEIVLQAALDEQRHALAQMRYLSRLAEKGEELPKLARTFVLSSQKYILSFAPLFYDSAYALEVKEFTADPPQQGDDLRCQYHPWNEVYPLFQKGMSLAEKTVKKLKLEKLDFNAVMQNQEQILMIWNETLAKMREPKQKGSCHATPLNPSEQKGQPPAESFQDIARLIQQMNEEDQQQEPGASAGPIKEGLKPW